MRQRTIKPVATVCLAAILLQGCAWLKEHPNTATGAGVGAVAGGALGYLFGGHGRHHHGRGKAMVGGALLGALAGGIIGSMMEKKDRPAQETNQAYNYQPAQGTRVEVSSVVADPNVAAPGGTVTLQVTYAVMAANAQAEVPVVETRTVTFAGTKVADLSSPVGRLPGTYTTQVPIQLRADSPRGQYQLTITVAAAGSQAQQTAAFTVN
ncbi:MAG TPA: glycine zipper domain-containing protein [Planctomycetota bacterium]|nr:glycine zipper domain-containing protein [Planctomycetota bacterium]